VPVHSFYLVSTWSYWGFSLPHLNYNTTLDCFQRSYQEVFAIIFHLKDAAFIHSFERTSLDNTETLEVNNTLLNIHMCTTNTCTCMYGKMLSADITCIINTINSCAKSAWYARRQHSYNICKDFLSHNSWMKNLNFTNSCTINMNWNIYTIENNIFWEISKDYQFQ
jgi:hypothetical protein